jgi:hypothetical protein
MNGTGIAFVLLIMAGVGVWWYAARRTDRKP